jgi:hypothetical protein
MYIFGGFSLAYKVTAAYLRVKEMNPFLMSPSELMATWKALRAAMHDKAEIDQLQDVAIFWAKAPLSTMAYDPEILDTYPTPWEMLAENDWCRNSIAIGMDFTLRLGGWPPERMAIHMIRDYDISDQKLVLVVDGNFYLNYETMSVLTIPETNHDIMARWSFKGRKYHRLNIE